MQLVHRPFQGTPKLYAWASLAVSVYLHTAIFLFIAVNQYWLHNKTWILSWQWIALIIMFCVSFASFSFMIMLRLDGRFRLFKRARRTSP